MIGLTLFATAICTVGSAAILYAVATRDSALLPATVNPFVPTTTLDPAVDTLVNNPAVCETLAGDWRTDEVTSLREVETVLDWLENHNVRQTELTNFNGRYQIRWR